MWIIFRSHFQFLPHSYAKYKFSILFHHRGTFCSRVSSHLQCELFQIYRENVIQFNHKMLFTSIECHQSSNILQINLPVFGCKSIFARIFGQQKKPNQKMQIFASMIAC